MQTTVVQTKLFALLHAGLAFRYTRWQHTAAVQTVLLGLAAAHTAWQSWLAAAKPTLRMFCLHWKS